MVLKLLHTRWVQLGLGVVIAFAIGVGLSPFLLPSGPEPITVGDRAMITSGDASEIFIDGRRLGAAEGVFEEELPLTAAAAVVAGWKDPVFCAQGRGRYFSREQGGTGDPYYLLYSAGDKLIGVYLYSLVEMPTPWQVMEELPGGGGTPVIDREHWGLWVYFQDPTSACTTDRGGTGGRAGYAGPHAVRSYEAPPTPTPPPAPSLALEAAAANTVALTSLTFTLTTEPEGLDVAADVQPSAISDIVKAIEEPAHSTRQWIDNVSRLGIAGTVRGEVLTGLVPSADADATVTVKVWLSETGMLRRLRIEGAAATGDPADAVRVLDLGTSK